jgi:hypothetical protein
MSGIGPEADTARTTLWVLTLVEVSKFIFGGVPIGPIRPLPVLALTRVNQSRRHNLGQSSNHNQRIGVDADAFSDDQRQARE